MDEKPKRFFVVCPRCRIVIHTKDENYFQCRECKKYYKTLKNLNGKPKLKRSISYPPIKIQRHFHI